MREKEFEQIRLAQAIFAGAEKDKDGYCGCPECGSRDLLHDGNSLDNGYIKCIDCRFAITGTDPYEMILCWNLINRKSFQLKIPF